MDVLGGQADHLAQRMRRKPGRVTFIPPEGLEVKTREPKPEAQQKHRKEAGSEKKPASPGHALCPALDLLLRWFLPRFPFHDGGPVALA